MKRMLSLLMMAVMLAAPLAAWAETGEARELYEFTLMQNFVPADPPEHFLKLIAKIEKELNLKINFQVPPSSNYDESLQLMLASGEYPDAVLMEDVNKPVFRDAVNNGLLISITPYLEEYGQNILKYSYDVSLDALKVKGDDEIYGIPRTSIVRADGIALRKDWADKLGIELPEAGSSLSLELFTEILRAFSKDDPDGNGVNDTFGLRNSSSGGVLGVHQVVAWSFGLIGWQEYDGQYLDLAYSKDHDNFKRALEYINMLWTEGYVDPDWPSITNDVADQRWLAGVYGVSTAFAGHVASYQENMRKVNPNAEVIWFSGIENADGKVAGGASNTGLWGFTSITAAAKHPERIVEFYDYLLSDACWTETVYGMEGVIWETDANGEMVLIDPNVTGGDGWNRLFVRRNNSPSFFVSLSVPADQRDTVLSNIQTSIDNAVFTLNSGFVAPVTSDLSYIDYTSEINTVITKIIVGDLPVDAWDAALEGYYKAGYQTFVDQTREYIESHK